MMTEYPLHGSAVADAVPSERAAFIRRTYAHLAGAVLAFVAIETAIFQLVPEQELEAFMLQYFGSRFFPILVLVAFIGMGWLARTWAYSGADITLQYAGLAVYVMLQAVIFVPILWLALVRLNAPDLVQKAGILTLCLFGGLTVAAFATRKDFSFLGPILSVASLLALGFLVIGLFFGGFTLGLWYSVAMVALAAGFILYDTSNIIHHFRTDQHVAASLELFASVAFLFFYVLRILLGSRR